MSWPPTVKLVLVEWIDSNSVNGWRQHADMLLAVQGPLSCRSVGWVIFEDDERLCLVRDQSETGSVAESMTIPRSVITGCTTLLEDV